MMMISAQNITKTYNTKHAPFTALNSVSIEIGEAEKLVILGKSGSGKSTLMHILALLDTPTSGRLFVNGRDVSDINKSKQAEMRAHTFGFVFQQFYLQPNLTVYENVAIPLKIANVPRGRRQDMVSEALHSVGLMDKADNKAVDISGGQKQRVAIARAIVNKPKVLFADEPTGNLDSATGEMIENLLFKLNEEYGITLVTVTHDHDLAAKFDRKIELIDGEIKS